MGIPTELDVLIWGEALSKGICSLPGLGAGAAFLFHCGWEYVWLSIPIAIILTSLITLIVAWLAETPLRVLFVVLIGLAVLAFLYVQKIRARSQNTPSPGRIRPRLHLLPFLVALFLCLPAPALAAGTSDAKEQACIARCRKPSSTDAGNEKPAQWKKRVLAELAYDACTLRCGKKGGGYRLNLGLRYPPMAGYK